MSKRNPLFVVLGLSAFFFVVFVAVSIGTVFSLTAGKPHQKLFTKTNNIGVIELKGVIYDSKKTLEQIETFEEDPLIRAVLVRINSPGGAVAPSQEIYEALKKLSSKKAVYSSMSSVAASGGYYVACGTKKIYASPGTITGSIGVIMQFADLSKLYSWAKINPYNIKTGRYKDVGSPSREMSIEEKELLQGMADNVLGQFRRAVASGRNLTMEKVVELSDGRIFSGEQAKAAKLIDELGGMNDAVEALAKEAGISGKPNLVYAERKRHALERILGDFDDDAESGSSSSRLVGVLARMMIGTFVSALGEEAGVGAQAVSQPELIGPLFLMTGSWR
ncbi:MAG: signal peptide peptidase SppA [Bdellovibrionota bacterium]